MTCADPDSYIIDDIEKKANVRLEGQFAERSTAVF